MSTTEPAAGAPPAPGRITRQEGQRLAYYASASDAAYWDEQWGDIEAHGLWKRAAAGWIPHQYRRVFARHLPREGRVVEAGCGLGFVVLGLRALGLDAEGVDWAAATVARVSAARPDLPMRVGDVRRLDVPDGHYAAYVSLGVMEHFREGPEAVLAEAHRVLQPGGVLLTSVPHFNAARRRQVAAGDGGAVEGKEFYQYAFTIDEFSRLVRQTGFELVEVVHLTLVTTLRECLPGLAPLLRLPGLAKAAAVGIPLVPPLHRALSHMVMFVARRPA